MPTVYCVGPLPVAVSVVVQVAVPVVVSTGNTSVAARSEQPGNGALVARLTNVTRPLRMSPGNESKAGSPATALMSRIVAERNALALEVDADRVRKRSLPL